MPEFKLDQRLNQDCYCLAESDISLLLLSKNADYPWLILVPKTTHTELFQLAPELQLNLLSQINAISAFLMQAYQPTKLNVAAIGNVVKQMHIHLVARNQDDAAWPGVVWGTPANSSYNPAQVEEIKQQAQLALAEQFRFA